MTIKVPLTIIILSLLVAFFSISKVADAEEQTLANFLKIKLQAEFKPGRCDESYGPTKCPEGMVCDIETNVCNPTDNSACNPPCHSGQMCVFGVCTVL